MRPSLVETTETPTGVDLVYEAGHGIEAELSRLVAEERVCCAVGDIAWDLIVDSDSLTVRIGVPERFRGSAEAKLILTTLTEDFESDMREASVE